MIEFRNGLMYKDGISILKIIEKDISLNSNDKNYDKTLLSYQENFWTKLMSCYIEDIEDDKNALTKLESAVLNKDSTEKTKENLFQILLSNPNIETIFKKSYYQFKSEIILGKEIKSIEDIQEVRDEASDTASEALDVGELNSAGIGFLSIFFSKKHRFMTDEEIKKDIFKSIIVWIIGLIITALMTFLVVKFIKI